MPDNVAITPGSGATIAASSRSVNGVLVEIQRISEMGSAKVYSSQANVTNSAGTLVAARDDRKNVVVENRQAQAIYVGPATVTTATGFRIDPGDRFTFHTEALLQAITANASVATEKTHVLETADI